MSRIRIGIAVGSSAQSRKTRKSSAAAVTGTIYIGGFPAAAADRQEGKPALTFRFYGVDGNVLKEDRLTAQ